MQSNFEAIGDETFNAHRFGTIIGRFFAKHEKTLFVLLFGFMAAWGGLTLYETNRTPANLCDQAIDLGIAVAVFGLIQVMKMKWLAKTYWLWFPLVVIGNFLAYVLLGLNHRKVTEIYRYNIGIGILMGIALIIFFAGILVKEFRNPTQTGQDERKYARWFPLGKKLAVALAVWILILIYLSNVCVVWFIPLIVSVILVLFVLRRYWAGALVSGITLFLTVSFMVGESYRMGRFFGSPVTLQCVRKLHDGGLVGTWALPTSSASWWQFANGEFVFATIGQVHGLLGVTCLLVAFLMLAYYGIKAACYSEDRFSAALVFSMTAFTLAEVMISALCGSGLIAGFGHLSIPLFTYGAIDQILGAVCVGLIFKQLKVKTNANLLRIPSTGLFCAIAGLAGIIWLKTLIGMLFGI